MRGKKYYALVLGLILVGIGTFVFYRQQQEARILEFEGYEISLIEEEVDALYNADKTDIQRDIPKERLEELETTFLRLMEKDFSGRNEQNIQAIYEDFQTAKRMFKTEDDVDALFEEERVVQEHLTLDAVNTVENDLEIFSEKSVYYERNKERVALAKEQVETIERARTFFANLYDKEGVLKETVTREDEETAKNLIRQIKNQSVREQLSDETDKLSVALSEAEETRALEAALEEQRLLEEQAALEEEQRLLEEEAANVLEEETVTEPTAPWTPPTNDGGSTWQPSPPPVWNPPAPAPTPPAAPDPEPEPTPEPAPTPVVPDPEPDPEPAPDPTDPDDGNGEE